VDRLVVLMVDRMAEILEGRMVGLLVGILGDPLELQVALMVGRMVGILGGPLERLEVLREALLELQVALMADRMVGLPAEIQVDPLERLEGLMADRLVETQEVL
jgi:hypothetical protein